MLTKLLINMCVQIPFHSMEYNRVFIIQNIKGKKKKKKARQWNGKLRHSPKELSGNRYEKIQGDPQMPIFHQKRGRKGKVGNQ